MDAILAQDGRGRLPPGTADGRPGTSWQMHRIGGQPLVSIELDDKDPRTAAICAELAARYPGHAGCITDVGGLRPE